LLKNAIEREDLEAITFLINKNATITKDMFDMVNNDEINELLQNADKNLMIKFSGKVN